MEAGSRVWRRRMAKLLLLAFLLFAGLVGAAMWFYPGGSVLAGDTSRYLFWQNFLSALGFTMTVSGKANGIAHILFLLAMCCVALALPPYLWHAAPEHLTVRWRVLLARALGGLSGVGFLLVGILPFDLYPRGHMVGVVAGFAPFLLLSLLLAWEWWSRRDRPRWHLLPLAPLPTLIALHAIQGLLRLESGHFSVYQPVVQKLIVLVLIGMLALDAYRALRQVQS